MNCFVNLCHVNLASLKFEIVSCSSLSAQGKATASAEFIKDKAGDGRKSGLVSILEPGAWRIGEVGQLVLEKCINIVDTWLVVC